MGHFKGEVAFFLGIIDRRKKGHIIGRRGVTENGVLRDLLGFVQSIDGIDTALLQSRVQDDCLDFNFENADVISMRKFRVCATNEPHDEGKIGGFLLKCYHRVRVAIK